LLCKTFKQSIGKQFCRFPPGEKLLLATIILQDLSNDEKPSVSAFDLLQSLPNDKVFSSPEEVNEHLKAERESWDN